MARPQEPSQGDTHAAHEIGGACLLGGSAGAPLFVYQPGSQLRRSLPPSCPSARLGATAPSPAAARLGRKGVKWVELRCAGAARRKRRPLRRCSLLSLPPASPHGRLPPAEAGLGEPASGSGAAASRASREASAAPAALGMEQLLDLLLRLFGFWFSAVFLLIVLPSIFGVSLGISELYLKVLVKTLEWATLRIEKQREAQRLPSSNVIIQRDQTTMEKAIAGLRHGDFELSDVFYFCKKGYEAIVEDEVTQRFTSEELVSWNLLTRTNVNFHYISLRLTIVWVIGVFVRYCLLLPLRVTLAHIGILSMICGTTLVGQLPNGETKDWLSDLVHLTCSRILVRALSGNIYYHNKENKPKKGGICVANHTSPIDVIILTNDGCYAMVGQAHGGLMGVIQRSTVKACPHVWFERSEMKDRHLVTKRLREHVADNEKLPILIFPEGTCINNTSVMMFKKGSFEIGGTIYPVAIKYDPQFGDAFWNSSKHGIVSYLLRIMTSWAIVCHVWYLPPVTREEGEDAVQFANRVKSAIARQGGLTELPWDGGLKRAKVKETFKEEEQKNYSKMIIGNGALSSRPADSD